MRIPFLTLCVAGLLVGAAAAQDDETYDDFVFPEISLDWDAAGDRVWIWTYFDGGAVDQDALERALEESLGCSDLESGELDYGYLESNCSGVLERDGLTQRGRLDFTPFEALLDSQESEVELGLYVTITHEGLPLRSLTGAEWWNGSHAFGGDDYVQLVLGAGANGFDPIVVEWGYDEDRAALGLALAGVLLLGPIGWTLRHRRRVLAQERPNEDAGWFAYWRHTQWTSLVIVAGWLLCVWGFSFWGIASLLLSAWSVLPRTAAALGLVMVPPIAVAVLCQFLSNPILDHLHQKQGVGRSLLRLSLLVSALSIVPLFFVLVGLLVMLEELRLGLSVMACAVFSRLILMAWMAGDGDVTPHAVTVGELRDRLFALAKELGVNVRQLYVLPTTEARMANAFAVQGGNVILTDFLLRNLEKDEVDGVIAHELAHLRHHHPALLGVALLAGMVVAVVPLQLVALLDIAPVDFGLQVAAAAAVGVMGFFYISRRFEYTADADAVLLTGEHRALIRGLAKLTKASFLPRKWSRWSGIFLTHPSLSERARAIASRGSLSDDEVREALDVELGAKEPYALPEGASKDSVYTTAFKTQVLTKNALALISLMALVPALIASAVEIFDASGASRWFFYGAGFVFACFVQIVLGDRFSSSGQRVLRKRLAAKLAKEGIDTNTGIFVGFAPHARPMLYENFLVWDVGFVFFEPDRLVYVGDQTRFEIRREALDGVAVEKGFPAWLPMARVALSVGNDRHVAWNIPNVGSVSQGRKPTAELGARIEAWKAGEGGVREDSLPASLPQPPAADVTCDAPRSVLEGSKVLSMVATVAVTAFVAIVVFGLPFWTAGLYVLVSAVLVSLVQLLPIARYREPV